MKADSSTWDLAAPCSVHDVHLEDELSSSYDTMKIQQVLCVTFSSSGLRLQVIF